MADVQVERGHIRIANNLWRAVLLAKLSPVQARVLKEALWRQYGWAKKGQEPVPFPLGATETAKAIGATRESASRAIGSLVSVCVLRLIGHTEEGVKAYMVEKDFDLWRCGFTADPSVPGWRAKRDQTVTHPVTNSSRTPCPNDHAPRDRLITVGTPETPLVVDDPRPLEPVTTKDNQRDTPIVPQGTAQVLLVPEAPKPDPVADVWAHWRKRNPTARKSPTKKQRSTIVARIEDLNESPHPVMALCAYFDWVRDSDHKRARLCRDDGYDSFESLMRPSHVSERMPWVREWVKGGKSAAPSERPEWVQWWTERNGPGSEARTMYRNLVDIGKREDSESAEVQYLASKPGAPPASWLAPKVKAWRAR